jgi:hypothetical protein
MRVTLAVGEFEWAEVNEGRYRHRGQAGTGTVPRPGQRGVLFRARK